MGASCTTTYDANGVQRQAVDPAGAAIGAVALGVLAYSVGQSRGRRVERSRNNDDRYPVHYGRGGRGQRGWGHAPYYR